MIKETITALLLNQIKKLGVEDVTPVVSYPPYSTLGDYSTNIVLLIAKKLNRSPMELAEEMRQLLLSEKNEMIKDITVIKPGFINFILTDRALIDSIQNVKHVEETHSSLRGAKVMYEYAHPNTHKQMHIGHMRTLIIGEALSRLSEASGAEVFRANYQGDIGLHVAKALYGVIHTLTDKQMEISDLESLDIFEKMHFLGQGYARGEREYEENKAEIDRINKGLYHKDSEYMPLYLLTRQWSLDYFSDFYKQFYTRFDRLFFESEIAEHGLSIVKKNIGKIFEEENGAVIFHGEKYGLHTRVFITQQGNPTYEGKDIGLGFTQFETFPFDRNIHIVANEQIGYFQVVIKVMQLIDPEKFSGEAHLPMGMVQLKDKKMSSRTGDVLTVDWFLEQVRSKVVELVKEGRITKSEKRIQ